MKKRISIFVLMVLFSFPNMLVAGSKNVSKHIKLIEISTTYDYGLPDDPLQYEFDAWLKVDKKVVSGSMQVPNGSIYPMEIEEEGRKRGLSFHTESTSPSVLDLFGTGTYTFSFSYNNGSSDSTSIDYALPSGGPIEYVIQEPQFTYPVYNAVDVSPLLTLEFDPSDNPAFEISISIEPSDEGSREPSFEEDRLPGDTEEYGPITLSPLTTYDAEYAINNVVRTDNSEGIEVVMDTDAECNIMFTTRIALGTPRITEFSIVGGNKVNSCNLDVMFQFQGNADEYAIWEKGAGTPSDWQSLPIADAEGFYHVNLSLEPYEPGSKEFGAKRTFYLLVKNEDNESKTAKIKLTLQLPKVTFCKVNGNNKAGQNIVPVTFKKKGDAVRYYLSGDSQFITGVTSGLLADLEGPVKSVYAIPSFDLSTVETDPKGKKTVYFMLENEVGRSNVKKVSVKMTPQ